MDILNQAVDKGLKVLRVIFLSPNHETAPGSLFW